VTSFAITLTLAIFGCTHSQAASEVSPCQGSLPQASPSETNRVEVPTVGCSIVSPVGWSVYRFPVENGTNASGLMVIITGSGQYAPRIMVQRLVARDYDQYHGWLQSSQSPPFGWTHAEFQRQPALLFFRVDELELDQFVYCERGANGFILRFLMLNKGGKLGRYYTRSIPIIEQYFETFGYMRPRK
jgi:hypothetical protein